MPRETTVLPAKDGKLLADAEALLREHSAVSLSADGHVVALPPELKELLGEVVRAMRRGQAVTLGPLSQQLTTQEAADLLGISRPTLIKLLEKGRIPYETPGRHRRLRLVDVLTYRTQRRRERRSTLDDLAADAQELGPYDEPAEGLEVAIDEARRKLA